jgi:hypothetical protein
MDFVMDASDVDNAMSYGASVVCADAETEIDITQSINAHSRAMRAAPSSTL